MNIEQAKAIPLASILEKIGCQPTKTRKGEGVYFSPLRGERTPSFHVNDGKNAWYDFGEGKGGGVIDFTCAYLESQGEGSTVADALRWLSNMTGNSPFPAFVRQPVPVKKEPSLIVKKASLIEHRALISYLAKRKIPLKTASPYLVEVLLHNTETNKQFYALGMSNEEESHELRNPFFKGSAGTKAISFVRGSDVKPDGINIFEGMFDFVSVLAYRNITRLPEDTIILHSLSLLNQATPYIRNYGYRYACTWLDNDKAGDKATLALAEFFKTEECLQHRRMNSLYHPHKDVNAWHTSKPSLSQ